MKIAQTLLLTVFATLFINCSKTTEPEESAKVESFKVDISAKESADLKAGKVVTLKTASGDVAIQIKGDVSTPEKLEIRLQISKDTVGVFKATAPKTTAKSSSRIPYSFDMYAVVLSPSIANSYGEPLYGIIFGQNPTYIILDFDAFGAATGAQFFAARYTAGGITGSTGS